MKNKEKTPYKEWIGRKSSLSYLRTGGCLAKVNVPINRKCKLGSKTVDCVSLGYAHQSIAYRFLAIKFEVPDVHVDSFLESHDVTFFENIFPMKKLYDMSNLPTNVIANTTPEPYENFDHAEHTPKPIHEEIDSEAPRRSKRPRTTKSFGDDFTIYLMDDTPKTIAEAFASPDADDWIEAVRSEMDSIISNGTWELVDRPYGCRPVGCKWVFKKKLMVDGTIDKYKTRLVSKGYTQKEGEDFFDTYSPVARLTTIRVLLSLAASYGILVHQMDVKIAFLNGELEDEIYVTRPDGFVVKDQEDKVCKLQKSLYGLKQAPKQWDEKFDITLISAGFSVNEADRCVYYRHDGCQRDILCLYVGDILIFGTSLDVLNEVKTFLC
jgi:hypothetical protein